MTHLPSLGAACRSLVLAAVVLVNVEAAHAQETLSVYGYFSTRLEKVFGEPEFNGTEVVKGSAPREFGHPSFNIMFQHQLTDNFRTFVNLNGKDAATLNVANMWGEYRPSEYVAFRLGKTYRKFGLYNEILDAVPSYYGIEPPETFDSDHLLISRTSIFMVHGQAPIGQGSLRYSLSTDNGEGGLSKEGTIPLGFDLNYTFGDDQFTLGLSGYSSGGATAPDKGLGEGSPNTGVLPWMASDDFHVFNGYGEARLDNLLLQFEYAKSVHKAVRDPDAVVELLASTGVNDGQLGRFLLDPTGSTTDVANVNTVGDYDVEVWYFRTGYSFYTKWGEVGPYFQWDWYSNPETIASKRFGGDNEAGVADDGVFNKGTLGVMFRPIPRVAVKLDGSVHYYKFMGQDVNYPELRFDVSYTFGL